MVLGKPIQNNEVVPPWRLTQPCRQREFSFCSPDHIHFMPAQPTEPRVPRPPSSPPPTRLMIRSTLVQWHQWHSPGAPLPPFPKHMPGLKADRAREKTARCAMASNDEDIMFDNTTYRLVTTSNSSASQTTKTAPIADASAQSTDIVDLTDDTDAAHSSPGPPRAGPDIKMTNWILSVIFHVFRKWTKHSQT